jgi:DNA-binding GntR family transcriptional regulator
MRIRNTPRRSLRMTVNKVLTQLALAHMVERKRKSGFG